MGGWLQIGKTGDFTYIDCADLRWLWLLMSAILNA